MHDLIADSLPKLLNVTEGKRMLLQGCKLLYLRYHENENGTALLRNHCRLVDRLLRQVWCETALPASIARLAAGGYERGQLSRILT